MAKRPLTFLLSVGIAIAALALGPLKEARPQDAVFATANNHYKNSEFKEAIAAYESILSQGRCSAALYFNLGNAYFRRHQIGRALLSYERARRLTPRDADIQTNMQLARSQLAYVQPPRMKLLRRISRMPFQWVNLDEWSVAVLLLYLVLMTVLGAMALRKTARRRLKGPAQALAVIFVLGLCLMYVKIKDLGREALVVQPRAEARFAPFEKATAYFELSEGMNVLVIEEKQDWLKVERPDGKTGWVAGDGLALI